MAFSRMRPNSFLTSVAVNEAGSLDSRGCRSRETDDVVFPWRTNRRMGRSACFIRTFFPIVAILAILSDTNHPCSPKNGDPHPAAVSTSQLQAQISPTNQPMTVQPSQRLVT